MNFRTGRSRDGKFIIHHSAHTMSEELKARTKAFALSVVRLYAGLPKHTVVQVLGKQLLRSGTSVGAHYREACRARSVAEFISKIEGGLQELDETTYWLELLLESGNAHHAAAQPVLTEAKELTAIFVRSARTAKARS